MKRFSIRDILFTILVVALGVALFLTTKENLKLAAENKQLRDDAGLLDFEDQSKVNIVAIPSAALDSQAWRISLPRDSEHIFQIVFSQSNIPCGGNSIGKFPDPKLSPSMAFTIPPNDLDELVFRIDLTDDPAKVKWTIDKLTGSEFDVESDQAVWKKPMTSFTVNAKNETISCELGERITLFTATRRYDGVTKTWVNKTHADGITISLRSFPDLTPKK